MIARKHPAPVNTRPATPAPRAAHAPTKPAVHPPPRSATPANPRPVSPMPAPTPRATPAQAGPGNGTLRAPTATTTMRFNGAQAEALGRTVRPTVAGGATAAGDDLGRWARRHKLVGSKPGR